MEVAKARNVIRLKYPFMPVSRGLHSSIILLNVSTFCGICLAHDFPPIRQGDTGRCDQNGLG